MGRYANISFLIGSYYAAILLTHDYYTVCSPRLEMVCHKSTIILCAEIKASSYEI